MFNKSYPSYHSYGDKLKSEGSDGIVRHFRHPVLQVWALTLAEFICLFLIPIISVYNFYVKSTLNEYNNLPSSEQFTTSYTIWIFAPAAFMHVISRFLIFLSLTFTSASSYQMLWCANLIFTCVFSRLFLHKTLSVVKWFAVFLIVGKFTFFYCYVPQLNFDMFSVGVIAVGVSDENVNTERNPVLGDTLTIIGMLFWAGQLTYEEKCIKEHNVSPILALGLEGFFGFVTTTLLLVIFYFVPIPFDMGQPCLKMQLMDLFNSKVALYF